MNTSFASAMSRALEQTRAGDTAGATKTLQSALSGGGAQATATPTARPGRQPLGAVIDSLVNGKRRRPGPAPSGRHAPVVPAGATYERRRHDSAHGGRDYALFVPSRRDAPLRGLVVMLHGCTQDADDFASGTQMNLHAERENLVVVYPEQDRRINHLGCWNWFQPQDQVRGRGEPALLADLAAAVAGEHGVEPHRLFAAGLSAGGAAAAILGSAYDDVFAAVGVHSGLAPGVARDVAGAYAAMRGDGPEGPAAARPVRTIVIHGDADGTVHPVNAGRVLTAAIGSARMTLESTGDDPACTVHRDSDGRLLAEHWSIEGLGHAWSGGASSGSHTQPGGIDASAEMTRFFLTVAEESRT